ncbi:hypothetical protein JW756_04895 [Candidatus Woesearchaeota archaeon]|nr:hypothetical protein [Candidatus Woesearchaeota archaeon]
MMSIIDLLGIVSGLKEDEKELFNRFFLVHESTGKLVLPEEMKPWAEKSFGDIASVENQKIIKVFNKLTFEAALFNELRAKRPIEAKSDEDVVKVINESINDPFCKPLTGTPKDIFGRIKGKHCISASNVAKYDALHGLIVFKKHNPLDFSEKELQDYFKTALKWFDKAYKSNRNAAYPFLLWNCLWKSGASIIHGHMQLVLGEGLHYAEAEYYNKIRREYADKYKSDYFCDLHKIHSLIGLGFESKKIKIFTNIVPRKDKEVTLISDKLDKKFVSAIYKVANCLVKDLGVNSFNLGVIFPPIIKSDEWKGFPVIARIVNRGSLSNKTSDIGGVELYARSNVIETDPYKVFENIKIYF